MPAFFTASRVARPGLDTVFQTFAADGLAAPEQLKDIRL